MGPSLSKNNCTMASVRGILIVNLLHLPVSKSTSTFPPSFSMLVLTTSIPTPLPESPSTSLAVEKPESNISSTASWSLREAAASASIIPRLTASSLILSGFSPLPSSSISTKTWLCSWYALSMMVPVCGLPSFFLFSGGSMPWLMAFLTMCRSGSFSTSIMVLSSSVSSPMTLSSTSLFSGLEISLTSL